MALPHLFSCGNGTGCVDLKFVCDGRPNNFSCSDRSDQNQKYCSALVGCLQSQFKCSTGLKAYCIPLSHDGKIAEDCDGIADCPNGKDEDPTICVGRNKLSLSKFISRLYTKFITIM